MTTLRDTTPDEITTTDRTIMKYTLSGTTDASDEEEDQEGEREEGEDPYKQVEVIIIHNNDDDTLGAIDEIGVEIPEAILERYSQQFIEMELLEAHSPVSWDHIDDYPEFYDFNLGRMIDTPYPFIRVNATKNAKSRIDTASETDVVVGNGGDKEGDTNSTSETTISTSNDETGEKEKETPLTDETNPCDNVKDAVVDDVKEEKVVVVEKPLVKLGTKRLDRPTEPLQKSKKAKK